MSQNGEGPDEGDSSSSNSKKSGSPSKPPRPPPPSNCSKLKRPPSIQQHLDALQPLKENRVRWFVKEDKKWIPFNGCDSLAIERSYRQILALESRVEDSSKILNTSTIYEMPTVKGGLYEVDVVARECKPIYWKDDSQPVCRGTWFTGTSSLETWQPLSEDDSEQIEASHQTMLRAMGFQPGITDSDKAVCESQGLSRLTLKGFYVEWNDISDVWLYWNDVKSRIIRNVGGKIGFSSGPATQIHRGYHTVAKPGDRPPDISHLIFVVHGIGQVRDRSSIVKCCVSLRQCAVTVIEKLFMDDPPDHRVEFIPVEWRSSLKLDEGTIESITPSSVSGLRKVLNESMMDIMYYTSPFYRYEIIDGVRDEMNRLYTKFCIRNPSFEERNGKISIVAHSLGSVITYDILTLWDMELRHLPQDATKSTGFLTESLQYLRSVTSLTSNEQKESGPKAKKKENVRVELAKARSEVMRLEAMVLSEVEHEKQGAEKSWDECPLALRFKVENLFCVGSPLAVFLTLRGLRPQDDVEDHVLPKSVCKRVLNIYHPADPVAYRLEPLLSADYSSIPPVQLHRYDSKQSGYTETKPTGKISKWGGILAAYRVGFSKQKTDDEASDRSNSPNSEENTEEDLVVVHNAESGEGAQDDEGASCTITDGGSSTSSKRTGWIASLFGSSKPSTSSNSSQESEETSETDGGVKKKPEQAKNEEHLSVPSKVLKERLDFTLREGYMESNYWSAVTSHVSYWGSCDVTRFVLENCLDPAQNMDQP
ncbi:phospholipase DDHD1-like [Stylophora pistillata]|uniref:phospholipase DDHD1-like n=1 Tax=Stylophora pistillata TaxID=50429 RepID=UPI000C0524FA|nr:phospholipase DDHD1-like [Stylophora pistillata]